MNQLNQQLTEAISQLQPLSNNDALKAARLELENKINQTVQTDGMTQQSVTLIKTLNVKPKMNLTLL